MGMGMPKIMGGGGLYKQYFPFKFSPFFCFFKNYHFCTIDVYKMCDIVRLRGGLSMDKTCFMSGYEKRLYSGYEKSQADLLKDSKMLQNTVKECLGVPVEIEDDDGTKVSVPVAVMLVGKKIKYMTEHPEKIDLKELSAVLGESKVEVDATLRGASELFGDIVVKEKENETE